MSHRLTTAASVALLAAAVAGCGSGGSSSSGSNTSNASQQSTPTPAAAPASGGGRALKLTAEESGGLSFDHKQLSAKAGTVTLRMDNPGSNGTQHAIAITGNGVKSSGKIVSPGGISTVTAKLKPGTYTFYGPVPGHEAAGMKGTLTVS
jgi:uncharacterized cupredoxin-like copper-binding protein